MIRNFIRRLAALLLDIVIKLGTTGNPLSKENVLLIHYCSRTARVLRGKPPELSEEEKIKLLNKINKKYK